MNNPIHMGCAYTTSCGLIPAMFFYKYKAMQILGAVVGCAGILAATIFELATSGAIGLVFGILFLVFGIVGRRLNEE